MSVWDTYKNRVTIFGDTKREASLNKTKYTLKHKLADSLSYQTVIINGETREAIIDDSDNFNEKIMHSMPGDDFSCGDVVDWSDNHWLITEKDANAIIRTKVKLVQCNYLLKWIDSEHIIHEQWCVIEDGTKYLVGEYEDRAFMTTRGDSRIAMFIGRNEDTKKFTREHRFLIDDVDYAEMHAYILTKPLKVGRTYNNQGIYAFVLQESVSTDNDNFELGIPDYYLHFPKSPNKPPSTIDSVESITGNKGDLEDHGGKKVWL